LGDRREYRVGGACWERRKRLNVGIMAKCDLCELKEYTPWYARYTLPFAFAILECDSCDTPMAVLGEHRAVPTADEREFMIEALSLVARKKYGADEFIIDGTMRQIPDHCHIHARPTRWRG
jgi:hypothetical protein